VRYCSVFDSSHQSDDIISYVTSKFGSTFQTQGIDSITAERPPLAQS
jgi:hypothetical protein